MDIDIISGLYHYGLTIIKYEQDYCLVDLKTQEVYEKISYDNSKGADAGNDC